MGVVILSRKKWYERVEIDRVTKDYVKTNCKITKREFELLEIIHDRKLVRRDMLEIISPSYRGLGNSRTRIINRSINKLFQMSCVDKVHERQEFMSGNYPATISIDKCGSIILGIQHKPRIKHMKSIVNGRAMITRKLPSNYRHIHGVNRIEVDTILFCEDTGSEIIRWVHENPQELHYANERVVVIPDIGMELKIAQKPFYAFIEYDTGSESKREREPPIIRDKIIKYKKYKLSRLWENEYPRFPMLLLVTEDENRTEFFNRKCKENGLLGLGIYYENYRTFLERLASKA